MAELDFDHVQGNTPGSRRETSGHMLNLAGAACSVALMVGLGVWGYKLAVRDVNGVPVMRALAGPMRVAPVSPGGDVALHQGLSVNAVAAVGTAVAALPEQVLLAPPPVDLALEDAAGLTGRPPGAEVSAAAIRPAALTAAPPDTVIADDIDAAVALALADTLAEGAAPFDPTAEANALPEGAAASSAPQRSPRPLARPVADAVPEAIRSVSASAVKSEIDADTLPVGTRLVQLGAFDDAAAARAEWALLQMRFGGLMQTKSLVVQSAQSGGRTFYRLRAHGFADEAEARQFCAALVAEGTPCIPALHR